MKNPIDHKSLAKFSLTGIHTMVKVLTLSYFLAFSVTVCFIFGQTTAAVPKDVLQNVTSSPPPMTLKQVEKSIEKLTTTVTKMLLPYFVRNSDLNLTGSCFSTFLKLFVDIRKLKLPAIKLLDAIAKPPNGMLQGSFAVMGEYDECLSISVNKKGDAAKNAKDEVYHGQYCTIDINLPPAILDGMKEFGLGKKNISDFGKLGPFIKEFPATSFAADYFKFRAGICMPSTCTKGDLEEIIKLVLNFVPITFIPVKVQRCESAMSESMTIEQISILSIFGVLAALVCIGTIVEGLLYIFTGSSNKVNTPTEFLIAFSVYNNTKKLLRMKKDSLSEISCVNGMYVTGTFMVVIYHTYFLPFFLLYTRNVSNLGHYMNHPEFTLISTMGISIEAYFLFSGLFLVYGRFKRGGKHPGVNVIQLTVRRYFRLCPSLMVILGIIIVMPALGSGPVWADVAGTAAVNGKKWWYTYLGMYNNFLAVKDQTYLYLWFIPCLMQITIIGVILAWILSKNSKVGVILIILTAVSCNVALGVITAIKNYPPSYAIYFYHNREHFEVPIYTGPLSHVTSFCVGMLLGYYMSQRKSLKFSKIQVCVGWVVSFLLTVGIQYLLFPFHDGKDVNAVFSSIYGATHKTAFSLGMAWIILACTYGYGGLMAKILCWKGFGPLSKLGYCAYLVHYLIIAMHASYSRTPLTFSHFENWMRIWSYSTLTFIAAYVLYITLELPLVYVESWFLPKRKTTEDARETAEDKSNLRHPDIIRFGDSKSPKNSEFYNNNAGAVPVKIVFSNEQSHL